MSVVRIGWSPVKGLRHERAARAEVDAEGLVGDRSCAVVDATSMATLKSAENGCLVRVRGGRTADGGVWVVLPDGSRHEQPLVGGEKRLVSYWGRPVTARVCDGDVAQALGGWLGRTVLMAAAPQRRSFVWDAPVSVVTVPELRELAGRLARPDLLDGLGRYRSNLVLDADLAVGDVFAVGGVVLAAVGEIERCTVMDQNPYTGERDAPVMRELARYRRGPDGIALGLRCRVLCGGVLDEGAAVEVRDHAPRPDIP